MGRAGLKVVLLGVAVAAAFSTGCGAPGREDHSAVPASVALTSGRTFAAPATDSLQAPIFEASAGVLAPGATLTVGQGFVNPMGGHQWNATLMGAARFTISGDKRFMRLEGPAGHAALSAGVFEVSSTPTKFVVHTVSGDTALLYKPKGLFAWIPRKVPPDDVGTADQEHWKMTVTRHR
jgi:hypothetical protein